MGLIASKPAVPATVPTDTIIPLSAQDDTSIFRSMVLDFTLRFDDVLDADKLISALTRLLELGDWRKLGGRLRLNRSGKLEYHVPASFDEKRPGFNYSHVKYGCAIQEHPLASRLPKATACPSVQSDPTDFRSLARHPDTPSKIEGWLYSDEPQLFVHIVSFEDATLVSLTWPHTFLDAMGRAALFDAWTLVLTGREKEVPPLHGFDSDPLVTLGSAPTEKFALASHQVKGFYFFLFVVRYIFELLWYRKDEIRLVCLPASHVQSLKQTALQELAAQPPSKTPPFLSDGDIICAWWSRMVVKSVPVAPNRTILIMNAFGLRSVLANDLLPRDRAYVANAVSAVFALMPASSLLTKPLSDIASAVRRSIQDQGTRAQVEASTALAQEVVARTGHPPVFGDGSTQMIVFSNWTKARFYELDFSAAVAKRGEQGRNGRPTYLHVSQFANGISPRYAFPIFGVDGGGTYWLAGVLRTETWRKIEKSIAEV